MTPANAYVVLLSDMPIIANKLRDEFSVEAVKTLIEYFTINQFSSPPKMALLLRRSLMQIDDDVLKKDIKAVLDGVTSHG
jgi:hypothetical protein